MKSISPSLVILTGSLAGQKVALPENERRIFGRDQTADICLPEKRISRKHSQIFWDPKLKKVKLEDLQSLNGTHVNGRTITGPTDLVHGDRIQIGSFLLEFHYPLPAQVSTATKGAVDIPEEDEIEIAEDPSEIDPSFERTGGRMISGKIGEISLPDLIQLLASSRKSGRLVLSKQKLVFAPKNPSKDKNQIAASLFIEDGILIYCEYGNLIGEKAFLEAFSMDEGYFALFPHHDFDFAPRLDIPLEVMLLDAARKMDEQRAFGKDLSADDIFEVNLDESLAQLNPDQLKVFQLLWKQKKVGAVWALTHLDKKATNQIIKDLIKMNYLRPAKA